ncbi:unnamed protein product [Effrenium voratum]|uniref:ADF-H domain-containing protein n=1 Tax=Effrenium voratum TaxID=2562239 RepID=A0AA36IZ52_9DINO|nr:unnamed protein product [Effrenium voratum]CAJ1419245.1 unnamed protein product [Effrenium voratum]
MAVNVPVEVVGAGSGGIPELQPWIDEASVQWALLQFSVGQGTWARQRTLFLHINGEKCPAVARGRANELTAEVQQLLREGFEGEAFHASLEVKTSEEVTTENLLKRVLPFFTVDGSEAYSVQWLQSQYEQQISAAKTGTRKSTAAPASEAPISATKRGTMYELCHTSFKSGRDALKAVAEPMGAWNWAFFTAGTELTVVDGGIGSVDEMRKCYEDHPGEVLFGLLRLGFGEGRLRRTKYVFIHATGEKVGAVARGRLAAERPKMEEVLGSCASISATMELMRSSDLTLQEVMDRVRRAAVVDDDVLDRDRGTPSVFSVEAFQRALQEEKKARMDEIRAQRRSSGSAALPMAEWSERSVEEVVSLFRRADGPLNWVLFAPETNWLIRRRTMRSTQASLVPSQILTPSGGYLKAASRSSSRASTPVKQRPGDQDEVTDPADAVTELGPVLPAVGAADGSESPPRTPVKTKEPKEERHTDVPTENDIQELSCKSTAADGPWTPEQDDLPRRFSTNGSEDEEDREEDREEEMRLAPKSSLKLLPDVSPPELRLSGPLLKQSSAWHGLLQLRWFQIRGGHLLWWQTPTLVDCPPSGSVELRGMKVQRKDTTKFTLTTSTGKDKVYLLDSDCASAAREARWVAPYTGWPTADSWVQALEQECILHRKTIAAVDANSMASAGRDLLRSLFN